jgi:quinol monooxygenase YgiN
MRSSDNEAKEQTMEPLTIIAITVAAPGQERALRAAQEKLVAETVKEPGCLRYELNQSLDDGRVLIFVESWASEALWRAHMEGAAIRRFAASGANKLIQEFTLHRMATVADGSHA